MLRGPRAIFKRDFKKFLSNPFIIVSTLLIPVMYLIVFGSAIGGTLSHVPVGVVQEAPPYNDTPLFTSAAYQLNHISQGNQNDAEKLLDVTVYPDEAQAKQDLENGKISAVIVFPSSVSSDNAVRLYVDSSDSTTPPMIEAALNGVLLALGASNPVTVDKIYGDITYIQFFGVGVIVMAIFTSTSFGGGIALIKDRENGIHEGYLVTPVKRSSIILGIISSGTVRAFIAGFVIFWIDLMITGLTLQNFQDFVLVLVVILIVSIGVTSFVVSFASRFSSQQEYQPGDRVLQPHPLHDLGGVLPGDRDAGLAALDHRHQPGVLRHFCTQEHHPQEPGDRCDMDGPCRPHDLLIDDDPHRDFDVQEDAGVRGGGLVERRGKCPT